MSQKGIKLTRWRLAIRQGTSSKPFTREASGQDGAGSQEGIECSENGFRVTMKASCSRWRSQGIEMNEILLSFPIRGPITNQNYVVLPRFTADIRRK